MSDKKSNSSGHAAVAKNVGSQRDSGCEKISVSHAPAIHEPEFAGSNPVGTQVSERRGDRTGKNGVGASPMKTGIGPTIPLILSDEERKDLCKFKSPSEIVDDTEQAVLAKIKTIIKSNDIVPIESEQDIGWHNALTQVWRDIGGEA